MNQIHIVILDEDILSLVKPAAESHLLAKFLQVGMQIRGDAG